MTQILVIEDNTELQELYREGLSKRGFNDAIFVDTAAKGMAAMNAQRPDLVILDIMLPDGSNGFDLLEQMKKDPQLEAVPVVVITNLDSQEKTAREIGVVDYIVKANTPFEQILERVVKHLPAQAAATPPAPQAPPTPPTPPAPQTPPAPPVPPEPQAPPTPPTTA